MARKFSNGADFQGQRVRGVGTPTAADDAATKAYVDAGPSLVFAFDGRDGLRALDGPASRLALVRGAGVFVWVAGASDPDDDETCFATASGRWYLEAAGIDAVWAYLSGVIDQLRSDLVDWTQPTIRVLTGQALCTATTIATVSSVTFVGTVTGAVVGDRVVATPPAALGDARLSAHAIVSAPDTVQVTISNPSASTATLAAGAQANWAIAVIKELP